MTRRSVLRCLPALAVVTLPLAAGDLNGRWTGTATTSDRSENVLVILRVWGAYVEGSLGPNEDRRFPIENGRFEGNKLTFQLTGPHEAVFHFDLTLDDNTLRGPCTRTLDGHTENGSIELKRAI